MWAALPLEFTAVICQWQALNAFAVGPKLAYPVNRLRYSENPD